ncbi:hypothetical protein BA763_15855 [Burkholderia cenocepacia]|nr:hypothetical protein BA763_15855 [Burkholderia cenocepacia]
MTRLESFRIRLLAFGVSVNRDSSTANARFVGSAARIHRVNYETMASLGYAAASDSRARSKGFLRGAVH